METHNKFKEIIFVLFLLFVIIGGYFLMDNVVKNVSKQPSVNENISEPEEIKDIRLDKTKEYIYFSDTQKVMEELDIEYRNINLNFGQLTHISTQLNEETSEMYAKIQYDDTLGEDAPYHKLSYAEYKKEEVYAYENYLSLVINYFTFDPEEIVNYVQTKTFIFDKQTGKEITNAEILNNYNLTTEDVRQKIEKELASLHLLEKEQEIDVDLTMENISQYSLYVDRIGRLSISILVKSNQKDYNEIIVLS